MQDLSTFRLFERINILLQAEERKGCTARGLKLVHARILDYLASCSSHSDTPMAVAEYLGLTKGTVSQSISVLERKGYLIKTPDSNDKRVVHLSLSLMGSQLLAELKPLDIFAQAELMIATKQVTTIGEALRTVLLVLQQTSQAKSFGVCGSCAHFIEREEHNHCAVAQVPVSQDDAERICRHHVPIHTI
ncbi:MAG: helix-turn-helix domain-containing protein [Methylococcales bacterium]|nr:helix-turn-helix domain-containing protein [Methylococcales bacterium]MDP3008399.1 helix-turn-helix domain-containing protein [Methylococcales bacterium]